MKRWLGKHPRGVQWFLCGVVLYLLLVLQTIPGFFQFGSYKLSLMLPFAITMAVMSNPFPAAILGAVTGTLWDIASGRLVGFGGIVLMIICFFTAAAFLSYFRQSRRMCGLACMAGFAVYGLMDYIFYYLIGSYTGFVRYILVHIGIGSVVSFALGLLFFGLCRGLNDLGSREPKY